MSFAGDDFRRGSVHGTCCTVVGFEVRMGGGDFWKGVGGEDGRGYEVRVEGSRM